MIKAWIVGAYGIIMEKLIVGAYGINNGGMDCWIVLIIFNS